MINHARAYLSRRPKLYAFIVGIGIVLFWRGVWHSIDTLHDFIAHSAYYSSMDYSQIVWWDGPLSLVIGWFILQFAGAFISSFIGNELILSGLRGEKKLNEKTETELKGEVGAIAEIKEELAFITKKLEQLEIQSIEKQ